MALLKPYKSNSSESETDISVGEAILVQAGVDKKVPLRDIPSEVENALHASGLGIKGCVEQLSYLAKYSEQDPVKLNAVKLGLQLNRALDPADLRVNKDRQIIFVIQSQGSVNLQNIFNPTRGTVSDE